MVIRERIAELRETEKPVNEFVITGKIQSMNFDGKETKICLRTTRGIVHRTGVREAKFYPNFIIRGELALKVVTTYKKYDGIELRGHIETLVLPNGKDYMQTYVVDTVYAVAQNFAEDTNICIVRGKIDSITKKEKVTLVKLEEMSNDNGSTANIKIACFVNIKEFVEGHCNEGDIITVGCYIDSKRVTKIKEADDGKEKKIVDLQNLVASEITCD